MSMTCIGDDLHERFGGAPVTLAKHWHWLPHGNNPTIDWSATVPSYGISAYGATPGEAVERLLDSLAVRQDAHYDAPDPDPTVEAMNRELDAENVEALEHRRDPDHA